MGFSKRFFETALNAVAVETPSSAEIDRQEAPSERRRVITRGSAIFRGLPRRLPFARAFRRPARTRSAIRLRSSSATAPSTVKTILPVGVLVSTCSESDTNSIPSDRNSSRARSKCETERQNRSNFQQTIASNLRFLASTIS